jgi:prepilin-type processing-associated H-X9-DG protein
MTVDQTSVKPRPAAQRPFQFRLVHLIVATALIGILLATLVPALRSARDAAHQSGCRNNLRQLAIGLHNYHDIHNQFPPAYFCDATGKPAHSWRVLISPFLEASPFYDQYSFSEPWNGPNNSKLIGMSRLFKCPAERSAKLDTTNYVAIVGEGTIWPDAASVKLDDITDSTSETIMIVEIAHSNIHWMEPRDLPIDELDEWLDPTHRPRLFGNHLEGGMVAYADGSVEMLSRDVTIERLRALASRAGKDVEAGRETKP